MMAIKTHSISSDLPSNSIQAHFSESQTTLSLRLLEHVDVEAGILGLLERLEIGVDGVLGPAVEGLVEEAREDLELVGIVREPELAHPLLRAVLAEGIAVQADPVLQGDQGGRAVRVEDARVDRLQMLALER